MKNIVIITGITSFLGKSLAKYLLSKGFIVCGIVRPISKKIDEIINIKNLNIIKLDFDNITNDEFNNLEPIKFEIDEFNNISKDLSFIHFGWNGTLDRNNFAKQMTNIDMSIKTLKFAEILQANRFIFAGSQAEKSKSAYGLAKKQFGNFAYNKLKNSNMNFIHLRIFSIYGKGDRDNSLIKSLVYAIKHNIEMDLSSCDYLWNYLFIDDFVNIIYKLIKLDAKTDTYDIASNDTRLLKDYVIEAHKVLKANNILNFGKIPDSVEKFAVPNIDKLLHTIGIYNFTKFEKGILTI